MAILLVDDRRAEPIKASAEAAPLLRFRTPLDLTGAVVRWELVDARTGAQVALEEATVVTANASGTEFEVQISEEDTMVAGRFGLILTYQPDGVDASQAIPGGRLRLNVTGSTRTSTLVYIEGKVQEAATSAGVAQQARTGAETALTGAQQARTGAEAARTGAETALTGAQQARTATAEDREAVRVMIEEFDPDVAASPPGYAALHRALTGQDPPSLGAPTLVVPVDDATITLGSGDNPPVLVVPVDDATILLS